MPFDCSSTKSLNSALKIMPLNVIWFPFLYLDCLNYKGHFNVF